MDLTRRRLLVAGGLAVAGGAAGLTTARRTSSPVTAVPRPAAPRRLELRTTVSGLRTYAYLPFDVPAGIARLDVAVAVDDPGAVLGVGVFDERGPGYQSAGFRGVSGAERSAFSLSARDATEGYLPGPVRPGTWTLVVPVFVAPRPAQVTVTVDLVPGPEEAPLLPERVPGVVLDRPGWYRGDLHCHTTASSDAWRTGSALTPAGWAEQCRREGLDFVAVTDHNVVSQNLRLARDAGDDVLLLAGEEMTNWAYGHATVSGLQVGDWLDWRQAPVGQPLPEHGARLSEFLRVARATGAYVSAAHPSSGSTRWQFDADAEGDRPDGYEVWTGPFQDDDEQSLRSWDAMLQRGQHVVANGGSDLHGRRNEHGYRVGTPTTVVHAAALSKDAVVAALRAGRCFVTRRPDGVECYLTASLAGRSAAVGGTVWGGPGDEVEVSARVRGGRGMRLLVWSAGRALATVPLDDDDQTVGVPVRLPEQGTYVRAEVRGRERRDPARPLAFERDLECLTNPVWLAVGDPPGGPQDAPAPPPARPGPRRRTSG